MRSLKDAPSKPFAQNTLRIMFKRRILVEFARTAEPRSFTHL